MGAQDLEASRLGAVWVWVLLLMLVRSELGAGAGVGMARVSPFGMESVSGFVM